MEDGWRVHSGGAGQYRWWVARYRYGVLVDFLVGKNERVINFKTHEAAQKRADRLNRGGA